MGRITRKNQVGAGLKREPFSPKRAQLELDIKRRFEVDRNHSLGGRSFYFFDFDDNVAFLSTSIYIFHKETGEELRLSTTEFGEHSGQVGNRGPYKDFEIRLNDDNGSFRSFRDHDLSLLEKFMGKRQIFIEDLAHALGFPEYHWQGPSWNCFYHAVYNRRPLSIITARGHHPDTIKNGVRLMIEEGHLPHEPNYLAVYPVNHPDIRENLSRMRGGQASVAEMKQAAIRASVERAFSMYGHSDHHRFGMSDDDSRNVELIIDELIRLKRQYPRNSFFVFDTSKGQLIRREVFADGYTRDERLNRVTTEQLSFFNT